MTDHHLHHNGTQVCWENLLLKQLTVDKPTKNERETKKERWRHALKTTEGTQSGVCINKWSKSNKTKKQDQIEPSVVFEMFIVCVCVCQVTKGSAKCTRSSLHNQTNQVTKTNRTTNGSHYHAQSACSCRLFRAIGLVFEGKVVMDSGRHRFGHLKRTKSNEFLNRLRRPAEARNDTAFWQVRLEKTARVTCEQRRYDWV